MIIGTSIIKRMISMVSLPRPPAPSWERAIMIIRSIILNPMIMRDLPLGGGWGRGGRLLLGHKGRYLDSAPCIPGAACPPRPPQPPPSGGSIKIIGLSIIERIIIIAFSQEGAGESGRGTMLIIRSTILVPMIMIADPLGGGWGGRGGQGAPGIQGALSR